MASACTIQFDADAGAFLRAIFKMRKQMILAQLVGEHRALLRIIKRKSKD